MLFHAVFQVIIFQQWFAAAKRKVPIKVIYKYNPGNFKAVKAVIMLYYQEATQHNTDSRG